MNYSPFDILQQNADVSSRIVAALERIATVFRVLLWNEGKELSLSPIQIQILIFLLHHDMEKRKVSYLAQEFHVTKATISDAIKSLEQKELIRKENEVADTRSYVIHLTEKGSRTALQNSFFANEMLTPVEQLNDTQKEALLSGLLQIIHHFNQVGIISIQRMCQNCAHYKPGFNGAKHFCSLMNKGLAAHELRLDCAEHLSQH
jgi:DNA-binding MarR family transcriptional regulator